MKDKPKFIEALYPMSLEFDIEAVEKELGISWSDVSSYSVKWCSLWIEMKDGSDFIYKKDGGDVKDADLSRPTQIFEYDKDFHVLNPRTIYVVQARTFGEDYEAFVADSEDEAMQIVIKYYGYNYTNMPCNWADFFDYLSRNEIGYFEINKFTI